MPKKLEKQTGKTKKISASEIFGCFLAAFAIYGTAFILLAKPIAILKSHNPNNILEGCLYYEGVGAKFMVKGHIDGKSDTIYNMTIKRFPYAQKSFSFNQRNHCYKVQYIVVDFGPFTDFPLLNQYFIYDYIGE